MKYLLLWLALSLVFLHSPAGAQTVGPAVVQPDASLMIDGRRFVLADIEIIPTGRRCDARRSQGCDTLAAVALRGKIEHVVSCQRRIDLPNPEAATCLHITPEPGIAEDLAAYLIENGWATAVTTARPLYHTLELIAHSQGRGAWGTTIDQLINPQPR
ncbi:MAG: hypothetical protein RID42_06590 [Alphaproteobacteria bacterium]